MSYYMFKEKHGNVLIDLTGIRFVEEISANPAGGAPRRDEGRITYWDGCVLEVSRECAVGVQAAFQSTTIKQRAGRDG